MILLHESPKESPPKSAPQNIINQYEEGRSVPSHLTPAVIDALTASDQEMPNAIDAAPIFELDHHIYDKVLIPGEISDIGFKKAEQASYPMLTDGLQLKDYN
jgi:hypothetical protein